MTPEKPSDDPTLDEESEVSDFDDGETVEDDEEYDEDDDSINDDDFDYVDDDEVDKTANPTMWDETTTERQAQAIAGSADAPSTTPPTLQSYVAPSSTISTFGKQNAPRARLRDSSEKIVYFFALLVGGTIILVGKSFGWLAPWPAAILAVVSIVVYAAFAWLAQRENPVRADRLGDNCYYLGLVYTLASLIASLIMIEQGADVNGLIGNFGVALVSTAAGIVARLILIQLRAETDDVDQRARVALAETANSMQSDLLLAASVFRGLMIDAQESFRVSVDRTRASVEQSAALAVRLQSIELSPELMNNSLLKAIRNIESAAEAISAAGETVRQQSTAIAGTADAVERADTGMAHVREVLEQMAATLEKHRLATQQVIAAMEQQSNQSEKFTRKLEQNAEEARLATQKVYGALGDLSNSIVSKLQR
jgi:methyl-accepting chemotaxis protein